MSIAVRHATPTSMSLACACAQGQTVKQQANWRHGSVLSDCFMRLCPWPIPACQAQCATRGSTPSSPFTQASANEQRKRMAEVESTAISHRAEAASLFRQAEASRQDVAAIRQELSASRQSQGQLEAELRGHAIGVRAEADATVEAVRMQLAAATDKLKRYAAYLCCICPFSV